MILLTLVVSGCARLPPPSPRPAQLCHAPGGGYVSCDPGYHGSGGPWRAFLCCRSRTRGRRARFYPLREDHLIGVLTMNRKTSGELPPETAFHSRPSPVPELWCNARKPSTEAGIASKP